MLLWRWVIWFGAITGLAQTVVVLTARLTTDRLIEFSRDGVWMAPLANAALFGLAAIAVYVATRRMHRSTAIAATCGVFIFVGGIGPTLIAPGLHPAAAFTLLAGIAIQCARFVRAHADRVDGLIRTTLPALLVLTVVVGLADFGWREVQTRRAEASARPPEANAPNVILIVLDTVRAASLSLYGYERQTTPNLDAFARQGVVFDRAISTSSWTLPSHASMFTGRLPHEINADWLTSLDHSHRTLAEELTARGYATFGTVANLRYATEATGIGRGFRTYLDFPRTIRSATLQSWFVKPIVEGLRHAIDYEGTWFIKRASAVTLELLNWIDSSDSPQPFFAFVNLFDAHDQYLPPPPFNSKFGTGGPPPPISSRAAWGPKEIQQSQAAYDGAIAYLDHEVARLIDDLKRRQLLDNTLIVITSDHGEQFGENSLFEHGNSLYLPSLEVPLVLYFPSRLPQGLRVSEGVSLVDLPATILDLTGNTNANFPGRSLTRYWESSPRPTEPPTPLFSYISKGINLAAWLPVSKGDLRSVVLDGVHYIRNGDGTEELYDFERDRSEAHNLIDQPDMRDKLAAARRAVDEGLTRR